MTLSPWVKHLLRWTALACGRAGDRAGRADPVAHVRPLGVSEFFASISTPAAISALQLSVLVVAIVVPLERHLRCSHRTCAGAQQVPWKERSVAVIDLPFAVSPIVVGVALILLWGSAGLFGFVENDSSPKIISFSFPASLASIFVTVPCHPRGRAGCTSWAPSRKRPPTPRPVVADVLAHHPAVDPLGLTTASC